MASASKGISAHQIGWMRTFHARSETYRAAQACITDAHTRHPHSRLWGNGAAVVTGLSARASERVIEAQIESRAHLMSDEWKAFMAIGESFAKHETVKRSSDEYVRDAVHVNSVEGFNSRVRRTIAGVFHHISPQHADLYFHEVGFRWSQRVVSGSAVRKTRYGLEVLRTIWSRVPPALQLLRVFRVATGRQMRRSLGGGIIIKSTVAAFG
ncbi:IS1595 family transposase [Mesorhizobium sp. AA22]|nr:IS1595 family transposase [Mesorhizobium sp. AA22]